METILAKSTNLQIAVYKNYMKRIEFMHQFLEDSEIFTPDSINFRTFLIQSFTHLYLEFHYLSFLSNEDVDQELVRVSEILQILPANLIKEGDKLFNNMSEEDVHKFWMRFFTLFEFKKNEFNIDSLSNLNWENKINFLNNMNSTLHYLNYDFSVGNSEDLKNVDIDKEIEKWNKFEVIEKEAPNKSTVCNHEIQDLDDMVIEKLIIDLKQIASAYRDLDHVSENNEFEHEDFFINFIHLTKSILKYKSDLSIIDSSFLEDSCSKMFSGGTTDLTANMYFIKRCNNIIKTLKSKIKTLK